MSGIDIFDGLPEFLAIARHQSIRKAALELGITAGAVSQTLQKLERRLGVSLFHRTTRRISLTEAGESLLAKVGPAVDVIAAGCEDIAQTGREPSGTLRLIVERLALFHVMQPILPAFRKAWPKLKLDITVSNRHDDFVAEGFDAGILIGPYISQEMVASRLSKPFQWAVFGSPRYFEAYGKPMVPADLVRHECIRYRRPVKGDIYHWEFLDDGKSISFEPQGSITVNDGEMMRRIGAQGLGLIYSSTFHTSRQLADGSLEPALLDFSAGSDELFLYFTKTAQSQPKLRAFIDLCAQLRRSGEL